MQADDEIGKVAQLIPGMVGKALELFLVSLVTRAADLGPCRRLTAQMLKRAVEANGQFDFLADKVMGVPAGAEGDALGNGQGNGQGQGQGARRKRAVVEIGGEEEGGRMVKKSRESSRDDRAESEE